MKRPIPHAGFGLFFIWLLLSGSVKGQTISGLVFRDFNSNGTRETGSTYSEPTIAGVVVTAVNAANALVASATTTASGTYTLNTGPGRFRIAFSRFQSNDFVSFRGPQNGTDIQFASGGATNINLALNYPQHYCGSPDPALLVSCYVNGDPLSASTTTPGEAAGLRDVLVSLAYSSSGLTPTKTTVALGQDVGSVYGLAVHRAGNKLFSAAFTKRHVGFGTGGPGGIYITDLATNTSSLFTTLNAGADPHETLPASASVSNRDVTAYDAVGKTSLGDVEISDDGRMLYVVNLFDRRIYLIPIVQTGAGASAMLSPGTITSVPVPNPGCANETHRPFALKVSRGKLYVGMVCSNESLPVGQNPLTIPAPGDAFVYAFNIAPTSNTLSATATQVLTFPLAYTKGASVDGVAVLKKWYAWGDNFYNAPYGVGSQPGDNVLYPQPWLTDLEIDVDGSLIVGIRDRFGDQTGYLNDGPDGQDARLYSGLSVGDILRAGACGPNGTFVLESGGSVCNSTSTLSGQNTDGPGGGEFYDDNAFCCHSESSYGGLALLAGRGEVVNVSVDPLDLNSAGLRFFDNVTGQQRREQAYHRSGVQIYKSVDAFTFGKANGLGDAELDCEATPLQLGNRVWNDNNNNGRQDADETGIASVTLTLYQDGRLLATTVTDAEGTYYFGPDNVPGGVQPFTTYEIRITLADPALTGLQPSPSNTGSDNLIDSNGTTTVDNPTPVARAETKAIGGISSVAVVQTGSFGENDFSIDFGFNGCPPQTCIPITVMRLRVGN